MEQLSCGMTPEEVAAEAAEADAEEAERLRPIREAEEARLAPMTKDARYYQTHKAARLADAALVRAGPAAPPWLTKAQKAQMVASFQEAIDWEKLTGYAWAVDHFVPLMAADKGTHYYCGLHVPWNLETMTKYQNQRKGNRWPQRPLIRDEEPRVDSWDQFNADGDEEIPF